MPRASDNGRAELDDTTLARASRGEEAACTRFVAVYERRVFAVIGRIVGVQGEARVEDLAQDTFVRALHALERFSPTGPAKLSTWLLTIASRVALNELRRKRPPTASLVAADEIVAPDDHARWDARRTLQVAIEGLTAEQRAVLVLHDLHGLTDSEVAGALDLQIPAVKSRLVRARARLRKALTEHEHV